MLDQEARLDRPSECAQGFLFGRNEGVGKVVGKVKRKGGLCKVRRVLKCSRVRRRG